MVADSYVGRHPDFQPLDLALVDRHFALHVAEVRQPQNRLRVTNGRTFFDLYARAPTETASATLFVGVNHDAVLRSLDLAVEQLSLQPFQLGLFQIEARLLGGLQCPRSLTLGFEFFEHLLPREFFQHGLRRLGRIEFQLGTLDGELVRFDLQRRREAFARHLPRVLQQVLRAAKILLSDVDVRLGRLQIFDERPFGVLLDREFRGPEVFLGLNLRSLSFAEIDLLSIELILDRRAIQLDEHLPFLNFLAIGHDPQNGGSASDLALHVDVLGAFHVASRNDGDQQPRRADRVRQRTAGIRRRPSRHCLAAFCFAVPLPTEKTCHRDDENADRQRSQVASRLLAAKTINQIVCGWTRFSGRGHDASSAGVLVSEE